MVEFAKLVTTNIIFQNKNEFFGDWKHNLQVIWVWTNDAEFGILCSGSIQNLKLWQK